MILGILYGVGVLVAFVIAAKWLEHEEPDDEMNPVAAMGLAFIWPFCLLIVVLWFTISTAYNAVAR
jgi:hypothetical protein